MRQGKYAYFQGEIVPLAEAKVSVMTHALNYGTGVFAGMRGYWNEEHEQLYVFRPIDHFKRFINSAKLMRMEIELSPEDLVNILKQLLQAENFRENCYIRPLAYKSEEKIGVRLHDVEDDVTIFSVPFGQYVADENGAHACISAWRRVDDNAIPARGKVTGAYANSSLIKSDAILSGYDEAIVLNEDGHVSEVSAANIFVVRDGVAITPPITSNVLEGIVRRSVIHFLQHNLNVPVQEREIDRTELYLADEIFMCGTGMQIAAITQVEHRDIGTGQLGNITRSVRDLYMDVVLGREEKYRDWVTGMYEPQPVRG